MFGPMSGMRHLKEFDRNKGLPMRDVTQAEFEAATKAAGWSSNEIQFHGNIARTMGSHVTVGNEKLRIVGDGDEGVRVG